MSEPPRDLREVTPLRAPGMTDLMVTPESIDKFLAENPPPPPEDPRTPDQKRRDADGVDYGDLSSACPSGHLHYCPECGKQHMHEGGEHPDCELRGLEHSWNRWERHALDDRVVLRLCDRCGASESQRLNV